jgi:hypothetical protein
MEEALAAAPGHLQRHEHGTQLTVLVAQPVMDTNLEPKRGATVH